MAVSLNLNNSHYTELIEDRQVGRSQKLRLFERLAN